MSDTARYLVVAAQGLGDSLEATTLVRSLRIHDAQAAIDVVVTRGGPRSLFLGLTNYVNQVHYLPFWEGGAFSFLREMLAARPREPYDASFLAYPSARWVYDLLLAAFPSRAAYAHRVGTRAILKLRGARRVLVPVRNVHNVERNRDLLRAAGIPPDDAFGYLVPAHWIDFSGASRDRVAMHVGSVNHGGLAAKRWAPESFLSVARGLLDHGFAVSLIVGPDERAECERLLQAEPRLERFEGGLGHTARFLSSCALLIANDNGIAHLAAGVSTPVIALFGPTPLNFAPFASPSLSLRPSPCPPCFDVRRPIVSCARKIDFACLKRDLTPELVLDYALAQLG